MNVLIKLMCLILLVSVTGFTFGQSTLLSSGGTVATSEGSLSYSLGQLNNQTSSISEWSIVEGVQQPFEVSQPLGNEDEKLAIGISMYPNPANDIVVVTTENFQNLELTVLDINGKVLLEKKLTDKTTPVDMSAFSDKIYLIKINNDFQSIRTFKLIRK